MGILLVYDVCDEVSFQDIHNWMKNIEQHASDSVNKILIGNKCDMDSGKVTCDKMPRDILLHYYD